MNIVVTGGTGFIGRHLVSRLKELGYKPVLFNKKKHNIFNTNSLKRLFDKKNVVIHLAAINRDPDTSNLLRINILGTKNILDAMALYCPEAKLIFISSFQSYLPSSVYGASKKIAEELIIEYSQKKVIKNSIILKLTNIYGSDCKPFYNSVIATFLYLIKKRKQLVIDGDGTQKRDYLYIDDAVEAIIKSIDYEPKIYQSFDICTAKILSLKQVIETLRDNVKSKIDVNYQNKKIEDWLIKKNYSKAKKLLGWEPKINFNEGIKKITS